MSKNGKYTVIETESYLLAFENMLNRFKKSSQVVPLANLSRITTPSSQNFQRNVNGRRGIAERCNTLPHRTLRLDRKLKVVRCHDL
ncbi:hypothetical protein AHAS_Ahas18G0224000 [Arachis hypogaea]